MKGGSHDERHDGQRDDVGHGARRCHRNLRDRPGDRDACQISIFPLRQAPPSWTEGSHRGSGCGETSPWLVFHAVRRNPSCHETLVGSTAFRVGPRGFYRRGDGPVGCSGKRHDGPNGDDVRDGHVGARRLSGLPRPTRRRRHEGNGLRKCLRPTGSCDAARCSSACIGRQEGRFLCSGRSAPA